MGVGGEQTVARLTPKQEAFAQGVADGLSLAAAFRLANQNALKWRDETVWSSASRMMADVKVSTRVEELKSAIAERNLWKREDSVRILADIAHHGKKDADRVRAVTELNSMHGYDEPKQVNIGVNGNVGAIVINIGGKEISPDALGW